MSRLAIVTATHFSNSPRVWREADTLAERGHEVTVVGTWIDAQQAELDRQLIAARPWSFHCAADLRQWRRPRALVERTRWRVGQELIDRAIPNPYFLGYAVPALHRSAKALNAELTILHLESALWVGRKLAADRAPVAVDLEDWHSQNFVPGPLSDRRTARRRAYLERLEREVLAQARYVTTTSEALADALAESYRIPTPAVVYNGDPASGDPLPEPRRTGGPIELLWFSQTLGPHRGLEDLFAALGQLQNVGGWSIDILAHGDETTQGWFFESLPERWRSRVRILEPVPPHELPALTARYDLGLCLERRLPRNRDLSVTNKILRYLQSGLFVLASDVTANREVLAKLPAGGRCYATGDPSDLARLLEEVGGERAAIDAARQRRATASRALFSREAQAERLAASVEEALAR